MMSWLMVTVIRPTSPAPGGPSRAAAGPARARPAPSRLRPRRRGRRMRSTAMACPRWLVTMTRHWAAGSVSAAWASWRAWAAVIGPIRPRVPGVSASPVRVVQGRTASSSPGTGRPSAGAAGPRGRDRAQLGPLRRRAGPERVVILLGRVPPLACVLTVVVEAVVGRGVLVPGRGQVIPRPAAGRLAVAGTPVASGGAVAGAAVARTTLGGRAAVAGAAVG